jgi:hypothetical protein
MTRLTACLAAALAVAASGCASLHAQKARQEQLRRDLDALRYARPLDEVWQEARRLLADLDYPLAGKDAEAVGQRPMSFAERVLSPARETSAGDSASGLLQRLGVGKGASSSDATQSLDTGWNKYGERYHLQGWAEGGTSRVVFTHLKEDRTDRHAEATRDLEAELDLARRLDPEAAQRIEAGLASSGG